MLAPLFFTRGEVKFSLVRRTDQLEFVILKNNQPQAPIEERKIYALAAHPKENLLTAGLDTGLVLFDLGKERQSFIVVKDILSFAMGKRLHKRNS